MPSRSRCRRRGPRDGWQRNGCRDDVGRHDGGNDRQHLDHSDDCDYCDYGNDDPGDHDDRHGSHHDRDDASSEPTFTNAEQKLVGLPRISTKPCKPDKAPEKAVAAIKCGIDDPVKVRHVRFPTAAAMTAYYEGLIPSGTERNAGTCGASDPSAENEFTDADGKEIGRLLCYEAGASPRLTWTNTSERIVSSPIELTTRASIPSSRGGSSRGSSRQSIQWRPRRRRAEAAPPRPAAAAAGVGPRPAAAGVMPTAERLDTLGFWSYSAS